VEICDDKILTAEVLSENGVPTPTTLIAPKTFENIPFNSYDFLKKAEEIFTLYRDHKQRKLNIIYNSQKYTTELFDNDLKAFLGDILSKSGELTQNKYKMLDEILDKIKSHAITETVPTKATLNNIVNITGMLPANTPKSIYNNPVYKFIVKPDKTNEDYSEFILSLNDKFNLQDIRIFKDRLNLRAALSTSDYDREWYNELAKQVTDLHEKTEKLLTAAFIAPTNNIESISASEAEAKLSILSKKFGYKNIGQMVSDMLKRYGIRAEIYDSPAAQLYRKYQESFAENYSTMQLNIERTNKKLFDWREINENII
jgi:hypothetical protein